MGQFALGIRSLLVKSAIFVVMAALLAWALGGTLFPKAQRSDFTQSAIQFDGHKWYWRLLVGGKNPGEVRWHLMQDDGDDKPKAFIESNYIEVIGPIMGEDGMYFGGRDRTSAKSWVVERLDTAGAKQAWPMPDRLAAVQQLERVEKGLPLQDQATISRQRFRVLDPMGDSADE
jgi:hypothetical protein